MFDEIWNVYSNTYNYISDTSRFRQTRRWSGTNSLWGWSLLNASETKNLESFFFCDPCGLVLKLYCGSSQVITNCFWSNERELLFNINNPFHFDWCILRINYVSKPVPPSLTVTINLKISISCPIVCVKVHDKPSSQFVSIRIGIHFDFGTTITATKLKAYSLICSQGVPWIPRSTNLSETDLTPIPLPSFAKHYGKWASRFYHTRTHDLLALHGCQYNYLANFAGVIKYVNQMHKSALIICHSYGDNSTTIKW